MRAYLHKYTYKPTKTHACLQTHKCTRLLVHTYSLGGWHSAKFGALRPEGRRFDSHSRRNVWTFAHSCLQRFCVLTPTQYQC